MSPVQKITIQMTLLVTCCTYFLLVEKKVEVPQLILLFARSASWKYFEEFYHDWETLSSCSTDGLNLEVSHYTLNAEQFFNGKDRMLLRKI